MSNVLLVEDSRSISALLARKIEHALHLHVDVADNLALAKQRIAEKPYLCAVLDLNLPDAPQGAAVELAIQHEIPAIVLTSSLDEDLRKKITTMPIIDYVIKKNIHELDYVISIVARLTKNPSIHVLVVDDMGSTRSHLAHLLRNQRFQVHEAANGEEALEAFETYPDIKLVLTDYVMPKMDGLTLIDKLRAKHPRSELAIIGLSATERSTLSANFLKHGANDYLAKPFILEELYVRVNQNLDIIANIEQITESANRDPMTRLYNRRYMHEAGEQLYASAKRGNITLSAAILDVDFFKKINDTYGHAAGDAALIHLAKILTSRLRKTDIVARYGGEEIVILFANPAELACFDVCEELRQSIEASPVRFQGQEIPMTVSIGVTDQLGDSFQDMLNQADGHLYRAKENGRNQTMTDAVVGSAG